MFRDSESTLGVFLAEDSEITRAGLRIVLNGMEGVAVVGEAADGQTAVHQIGETKPKVVLMDVALPVMDGIEATRLIKSQYPDTKVLMLTSHDCDSDLYAALDAGADGYCLKEVSPKLLDIAIRSVAVGVGWFDSAIGSRVLSAARFENSRCRSDPQAVVEPALSARNLEVLSLARDGLSNREIGDRLFISSETVKSHMRQILEKLAAADRTQAVVKAMRTGLI